MTNALEPYDVKKARAALGLTQRGLAAILRMGHNGERQVRRWEDGDVPVSGPASVAIEALLSGWRPRS
jgi:DNA-binding transcriptional regulator YiaG